MKKFISTIIASMFILALTGCGISKNMIRNQNQNQTSVVLSQANYKVIGTAKGTVESFYIFGLGGLTKQSLQNNAVAEMTKEANLQGSPRAIVNTNVTEKLTFVFPFYTKRTMTAEGTIIEFIK